MARLKARGKLPMPVADKIHVEGLRKDAARQRDNHRVRRKKYLKEGDMVLAIVEKMLADAHDFYVKELRQIVKS